MRKRGAEEWTRWMEISAKGEESGEKKGKPIFFNPPGRVHEELGENDEVKRRSTDWLNDWLIEAAAAAQERPDPPQTRRDETRFDNYQSFNEKKQSRQLKENIVVFYFSKGLRNRLSFSNSLYAARPLSFRKRPARPMQNAARGETRPSKWDSASTRMNWAPWSFLKQDKRTSRWWSSRTGRADRFEAGARECR